MLIELLVVIAIIGILASLLLPVLSAAKLRAKRALDMSNLHQWVVAFPLYAGDNSDSMPMGWSNPNGEWTVALASYNANSNINFCPMALVTRDTLPGGPWQNPSQPTWAWGTWGTPVENPIPNWARPGMAGSYGINGWMYNPPPDPANPGATPNPEYWRKLGATAQYGAGNVPVFGDCTWDGTDCVKTDMPPNVPGNEMGNGGISDFAILRHPNSKFPITMSFADNSVRIVGLKQLWTLKWSPGFDTTPPPVRFWPRWMNGYQ
jgi:hypothetical protein